MTMFIHFFCLCPLGVTITLNFNNYRGYIKSGVLAPEIHRRVFRDCSSPIAMILCGYQNKSTQMTDKLYLDFTQ